MRILFIEDEAQLREQTKQALQRQSLTVDVAADGQEGLYLGLEYPYDVAIIDLGLPLMPGIEVIKQLRENNIAFPILILTARGRWQDKVEGLDAGADDYLVKPFHFEELSARIHALARRASGWSSPILTCGLITLNPSSQVVMQNNNEVALTAYEYRLLHYLMLHAGEVISKTKLTDHIYEQDHDRDSNVIEVFIRRLRKKLDPDSKYNFIETLRGQGYKIKAFN